MSFKIVTIEYIIMGMALWPPLHVYLWNTICFDDLKAEQIALIVLTTYILGIAWDGFCALIEQRFTRSRLILASLYRKHINLDNLNVHWTYAQKKIWESKEASDEFNYHRLRFRIMRAWVFGSFTTLIVIIVHLPFIKLVMLSFALLVLFLFGFISASRDYHSLVDAAYQIKESN